MIPLPNNEIQKATQNKVKQIVFILKVEFFKLLYRARLTFVLSVKMSRRWQKVSLGYLFGMWLTVVEINWSYSKRNLKGGVKGTLTIIKGLSNFSKLSALLLVGVATIYRLFSICDQMFGLHTDIRAN